MKNMLKKLGVVLSLLVGSTSLQAQSSDPFGDFNPRAYKDNMIIKAQVKQNGNVVTDALVAVYCENELRGKKNVGNGTNPQIAYLQVYANSTGSNQYLYFKVYTNGVTFTYNPDPDIIFSSNGEIGTESEPYIITLPVSLANNADNSSVLTTYHGRTCDIVLTDRTLYKDGEWNTLCLPFDVTIAGSVLDGDNVDVRTLGSSEFSNGVLTLNFTDEGGVTQLEAGTPYIIKWDKAEGYDAADPDTRDLKNPVFTGVTINKTMNNIPTDYVDFKGTYEPMAFDTENKSILLVGGNNLYWPQAGASIKACRAYFQLNDVNGVREFHLNFGEEKTTGISLTPDPSRGGEGSSYWYSLDGRKLNEKPTTKGIYVNRGRKIVIK